MNRNIIDTIFVLTSLAGTVFMFFFLVWGMDSFIENNPTVDTTVLAGVSHFMFLTLAFITVVALRVKYVTDKHRRQERIKAEVIRDMARANGRPLEYYSREEIGMMTPKERTELSQRIRRGECFVEIT